MNVGREINETALSQLLVICLQHWRTLQFTMNPLLSYECSRAFFSSVLNNRAPGFDSVIMN